MKFLYRCFTYCYVVPLSLAAMIVSIFGRPREIERLGFKLPQLNSSRRPIWLVASSVGEVTIALKLSERLKHGSNVPVILSVTTATGKSRALQSSVKPDVIVYHPFDTPGSVARVLRKFNPQLIALVETELWPTLMETAFQEGIRVVQVSGRISARSARHYLALRPLFAPLLNRCSRLMVQSPEDAERLEQIAGDGAHIEVVGSIKEDYVPPNGEQLEEIKSRLVPWKDKTIFTCGSTRPTEETILCEAFANLGAEFPNLRLILAPRHIERTGEIEAVLSSQELSYTRWTNGKLQPETSVLLLDTIGKLNAAYHLSDITFVGGTLAPIGGHNLLEPALAGRPVLHGPHVFQQLRGLNLLTEFEMGFQVDSVSTIVQSVRTLLTDANRHDEFESRAGKLRHASSHILNEYVDRLRALLIDE